MQARRQGADRTTNAIITQARADLARHRRNEEELRKQIARAHRRLEESQNLLRKIDAALARFAEDSDTAS